MATATTPKVTPKQAKNIFTKVAAAREQLRAMAEDIVDLYIQNAKLAMSRGDHESAQKALQWLLEHLPADVNGVRVADGSIDKQIAGSQGPSGPTIQIGINVGGVPVKPLDGPKKPVAALEGEVIDG